MKFKGTESKWSYTKTKKGHYKISGKGWTDFAKVNTVTNAYGEYDLEAKANALLISKAPEMLEMLKESSEYIEEIGMLLESNYWTESFRDNWNKKMHKIKQLIKEATEI